MGTSEAPTEKSEHATSEGVLWFVRGACTACGKLTPPVFADLGQDPMYAFGRLRDMLKETNWWVDIYQLFGGTSPGIKVSCRCPICEKSSQEMRNKGRQEITTIVTEMDDSQVETTKGLT